MIWSRIWPWAWSRGKKAPVRRESQTPRLSVELLETRLVPSATSDPAYDLWRQQSFQVVDVAVANIDSTSVSTQATPTNSSFGNLIGLPSAFANTGYRGTGYSVVVIDTGIDYRSVDLGGGFGVGKRVIAGWDFVNNDADPMDDNGHGTHVAGIIGSSNATYSGVAPDVNLIALKVLDKNGSGSFGAVEDALKWVVANQSKYNIVAINMSIGSGNYNTNPFTFLEDELTSLKSQGVFTAVAAGNSFYTNNSQVGLGYPAISTQVVSVGAVWSGNFGTVAWASGARDETTAADRIASFSQRASSLSIMAPGAIINSTYLNNTYTTMAGTSMASPVVAGAAALLHQAMDAKNLTANQDTILALMKKTGATVVDGDDENDNVVNTGLSFKRLNVGAALADLGPAVPVNSAPVLQAIGTQNVAPGKSVVVTLNATDANGDAITYSARVVGSLAQTAYQLDQQFGLYYLGSYYTGVNGYAEKWMRGSNGDWFCVLPNGEFRKWTDTMAGTMQAGALLASFDARYYEDPSLFWNASAAGLVTPTLSIVGNQLKVTAPAGVVDGYIIEVTASDGVASAKRSFTLFAQNSLPVMQNIVNKTVAPGATITIDLNATDADGDAITYSARVVGSLAQTAYQLDQQYGLYYLGSYYTGVNGYAEKWMRGSNGDWFCVLPNGEFRKWTGSMASTMQAGGLVASFDARYYEDPSLFWNASAAGLVTPTLSIVGNQLKVTAPAGVVDGYTIEVTASDGIAAAKQLFSVLVQNSPPMLQAIANKSVTPGATTTIDLNATDADGDAITFSARIVSSIAQNAYQLDHQNGLYYLGSYYTGVNGYAEKWMRGSNGDWFCVLPNGEFRHWTGSMASTMQAGGLLATFDARYYNDPSLLWNATAASPASPTLTLVGNQLTVTAPAGVNEIYQIEITASDGTSSVKQTFALSVRGNSAPAITAIPTQAMQSNRSQTLTLSATDADGDAITYQTAILGSFANAPATLSLVGNQLTINTSPDFVGGFDVQVTASDGSLSSTTTFRVNVTASPGITQMQGDVNGDGLKDTILFNPDGSVWVKQAQANGSFIDKLWANWSPSSAWKSISVGDFDGDGRTDILGFGTGGAIWVGLSNGSAFTSTLWTQWSNASNWKSFSIADVDGDGKLDFVGQATNSKYYVAYSTATSFRTTVWTGASPPK